MIGLAYMHPGVAAVVIRFKTFCPHFCEGAKPDDVLGIRSWLKRYGRDPRTKVLFLRGLDSLAVVQAELGGERDWGDTVVAVMGEHPGRLAEHPDIIMVDAEIEPRAGDDSELTYRTHRFDLNGVLGRAARGFKLPDDAALHPDDPAAQPAVPYDSDHLARLANEQPAVALPETAPAAPQVPDMAKTAPAKNKPSDKSKPAAKPAPAPAPAGRVPRGQASSPGAIAARNRRAAAKAAKTGQPVATNGAAHAGKAIAATPVIKVAPVIKAAAQPTNGAVPRGQASSPGAIAARNRRAAAKAAKTGQPAPVAAANKPPVPRPTPVQAAEAPAPAKVAAGTRRPDSLSALFDGVLSRIAHEGRQAKVASWVASRIEGLLDKESWTAAVNKMTEWEVDVEIVLSAMVVLRDNGQLARMRVAVDKIAAGAPFTTSALDAGCVPADIAWLHGHWPILTPEADAATA